MTEWQHEPEFRQLMRQCLDGGGVSATDFDRLVVISRDAPLWAQGPIAGLIQLMAEESFQPDA